MKTEKMLSKNSSKKEFICPLNKSQGSQHFLSLNKESTIKIQQDIRIQVSQTKNCNNLNGKNSKITQKEVF